MLGAGVGGFIAEGAVAVRCFGGDTTGNAVALFAIGFLGDVGALGVGFAGDALSGIKLAP